MIIDISSATSIALLGLRIIVALVFLYNGWQHIIKPQDESAALGGSSSAVVILGLVEIIGALSVAFGLWIQIGAVLLILAMLGRYLQKDIYLENRILCKGRPRLAL